MRAPVREKLHELPELSEHTRQALQDYTALNTIACAFEALNAGEADEFQWTIITALAETEEKGPRIRRGTPLGRRLQALGLIRSFDGSGRGVIGSKPRKRLGTA